MENCQNIFINKDLRYTIWRHYRISPLLVHVPPQLMDRETTMGIWQQPSLPWSLSLLTVQLLECHANRMICFKEWLLGWADLELLQSSRLTSGQLLTSAKMCTRIYLYLN